MATSITGINVIPTIECAGIKVKYNGNPNRAIMTFRPSGAGLWIPTFPMYHDVENKEFRGSIFWLNTITNYEVHITLEDPGGNDEASLSFTTRDDNPAIGTNYIVISTSGDDTMGDGSVLNPVRSLAKVNSMLVPGATVLFRGGAYHEGVAVAVGGLPDNYINFMPYEDEPVTIDGLGQEGALYLKDKPYIRIKGFNIQNNTNMPIIYIDDGSHGVIVEDNNFLNCNVGGDPDYGCVQLHSGGSVFPCNSLIQRNTFTMDVPGKTNVSNGIGLWKAGSGHVFRNNKFTSPNFSLRDAVGGGPEGTKGFFESSDIYDNYIRGYADDGISPEGSDINVRVWGNYVESLGGPSTTDKIGFGSCPVLEGPCYIFRNVVWLHTDGRYDTGTKMGASSWGRLNYIHNTFYIKGGTSAGNGLSQTNDGLANTFSRNNIVYCTRYVMEITTNDPEGRFGLSNDWDYDLLYTTRQHGSGAFGKWQGAGINDLADLQNRFGRELHGISVPDIGFAAPENGDFELMSGSPAIDKGEVLVQFNDENSPWPFSGSAPDLGAMEYGGTPSPPYAEFSVDVSSGNAPLTVVFTNTSSGAISSYSWDFGDGQTSSEVNPIHAFQNPGIYRVVLTVSGPGGTDISEMNIEAIGVTPFSLTIQSTEGGTTTPPPGIYPQTGTVKVTAIPDSDYRFLGWQEEGVTISTDLTIYVIMDGDHEITAVFEYVVPPPNQYNITIVALDGGTTSPPPGDIVRNEGSILDLSALAFAGYKFDRWDGDISGNNPNVSVTVNSNMTIIAVFKKSTTQVVTAAAVGGAVAIIGIITAVIRRK